jgi:hypothetical protein
VLPVVVHDCIGCFADQVKLTHALVRDLDKAVGEIKHLGEHGEEASQMIMELGVLCKQHVKAAQKLREEKTTLDGMAESHDKLTMEFADEFGYNRMDEDADDEDDDEEEEDDNDGGDAATPLLLRHPPFATPLVVASKEIVIDDVEEDPMEMVLEQEVPEAHEVILADAELEPPKPCFNNLLMRDYEESPSRMMDDPHELDDPTEAIYDLDEWYPEDGSNDRD